MDRLSLLEPLSREFDLGTLRLPGESDLRKEIERRPKLRELIALWSDPERAPSNAPRALIGGLRILADISPAVARLGELLRRTLRLFPPVELVLVDSPHWICESFADRRSDRIALRLAGGVLDKLGVGGALFFVGRRVARHLYDQFPIPVDPTAGVDPVDRDLLLLRGLWRFQELTADRVGLLCCQDFDLAARTIVKAASGLPDSLLHPDWEALLNNRADEEQALIGPSAHDFYLLRLSALRSFAGSEKYRLAFSSGASAATTPPATVRPAAAASLEPPEDALEPMIAYDRFDPTYSKYPFRADQPVEVLLDGVWVAGRVREVDVSGDLRVYFADQNEVLRLSPTADLIRPAPHRAAG